MGEPEVDLFAFNGGVVTAPAGCGKTQLIAQTLLRHHGTKPALVLTHTNAGVAALKARLAKGGVPPSSYRVATIDGWALGLASRFPKRSGVDPMALRVSNPRNDYPAIRAAASRLVAGGHLNEALAATYAYLLVDEYQDCSDVQHAIVTWVAQVLRTWVFGDPMQAIFGFPGVRLVDWTADVHAFFGSIAELGTPWRWRNAGAEDLGIWLLHVRGELLAGRAIDLREAPSQVQWMKVSRGQEDQQRRQAALTPTEHASWRVLVVGDSVNPRGQQEVARQTPGATTVEAVDLRDLVAFGVQFDVRREDALACLLGFAAQLMTGVTPRALLDRVEILLHGRPRTAASEVERAACEFRASPTYAAAGALLALLAGQDGARVFRPAVLDACRYALQLAASGGCSFSEATMRARERFRAAGRTLPRRAVGSTLLLKGLEAEMAVILNPAEMNARHLYVALTRAARRLVVCSEQPVLCSPV